MTWQDDLLELIQGNWRRGSTFTLREVYEHSKHLRRRHPNNSWPAEKLRQELQRLRDKKMIEFVDNRGTYRRLR